MKRMFLISLLFSQVISGCTSVRRINDYSTSALKTLKKYEELGYTFGKACRNACYIEQVRKLKLIGGDCPCAAEQTADSVTSVLYNALKGYFDGLVKLSSGDVANYKTQALTKELKNGNFGDLKIDKSEVDAYAKLSMVLLKAFADGYRSKQLKNYVEDANEPVKILLTALDRNLASNLIGKLHVHKARLQSIYFDFIQDSAASTYEKKKIIDDYHTQVEEADLQQKQITSFTRGLQSMSAGHQKLFDNRNKMKAKEMKDLLADYASDLDDIISDFNKIKSK